jgi:hypothetical protein
MMMMMMAALTTGSKVLVAAPAAEKQEETLAKTIHNEGKGSSDCTETDTGRMSLSAQAADADDADDDDATRTSSWDGLVRKKLKLQACIEDNGSSPSKLVYGTLPALLKQISSFERTETHQAKANIISIVQVLSQQGILLPYASLLALINQQSQDDCDQNQAPPAGTGTDAATSKKLRMIQVQAMVRLQLWSTFGEDFVEQYSKEVAVAGKGKGKGKGRRTKDKKNKKQTQKLQPADLLLQETIQILALTAFRLSPDRPFCVFLRECLPLYLLNKSKLPRDTFQRIFDNFEVPNPYLAVKDNNDSNSTAADVSLSPQRRALIKKRKAAAKEAIKNELLAKQQKEAQALADSAAKALAKKPKSIIPGFPVSVSLTRTVARSKNSLLAGDGNMSRSRFVGSHFNTNLSNASTLFRQVKVADRRQQPTAAVSNKAQSLSRKRPLPSKSTALLSAASSNNINSASNSNSSSRPLKLKNSTNSLRAMPPPMPRRVSVLTPNKKRAMPPPVPRRVSVLETPNKKQIVHETPNKKQMTRRNNDIVCLETPRQPARSNSLIFATDDASMNRELSFSSSAAAAVQSNSNLVAQAFRAVQQRKR